MEIKVIDKLFTVCKINSINNINFDDEFFFIGKTDEEISLVCSAKYTPNSTLAQEDSWRAFRIQGTLEFSLVGILAKVSAILANENISIFAVSTFNTDYILTKDKDFEKALSALKSNGYNIIV